MADEKYLVLTAVGEDRPGLVHDIASAVHAAGANLQDSRMAVLGNDFAVLLLVKGADEAIQKVHERLPELEEKLGLTCVARETTPSRGARDFIAYELRVSGVDHPGIVQRVTDVLARSEINVSSLESRVVFAPLSGTPMFVLEADLEVPPSTGISELRRQLITICEDENLDFVLESA